MSIPRNRPPRPPHAAPGSPTPPPHIPASATGEEPPSPFSGFRPAKGAPPPPAPPLFECTGENARLDAMAHTLNQLAAPFTQAPPPHQGFPGAVAQALGGTLALINAPFQLLDTGFALVTAPLAAYMPALPAAVLGMPHIGMAHAHAHPPSLVPPAPPVPLPSIGTLLLPGAVNVLINGVPAARAGDMGLAVTCCSLAPPFEIILGSSSVFIGGSRAARMGDITRHDNPVPMGSFAKVMAAAGLVAGGLGVVTALADANNSISEISAAESAAEAQAQIAQAAGQALAAAMAAAQVAADAAGMALNVLIGKDPGIGPGFGNIMMGSPNVLIGGFPTPNLIEAAQGLIKLAAGLRARRRNIDIPEVGCNCP